MNNLKKVTLTTALIAVGSAALAANPIVGGAPMYEQKPSLRMP